MTDDELLRAWAGGDQGAGASLYRRHFDALYRFFRTKAPEAYEDLIQTTMMECMRAKERYRGDAPFRAFLFAVARNCLLHHFRSRFRDRLDFDSSRSSVADLDPRPSALAVRNAEHAADPHARGWSSTSTHRLSEGRGAAPRLLGHQAGPGEPSEGLL